LHIFSTTPQVFIPGPKARESGRRPPSFIKATTKKILLQKLQKLTFKNMQGSSLAYFQHDPSDFYPRAEGPQKRPQAKTKFYKGHEEENSFPKDPKN